MSSSFKRALPARVDLAQQKSQAKELLHAFAAGDATAISRVRNELPDKVRVVLADAQFVLAREYGFRDWSAFRQHIHDRIAAAKAPHERLHHAMQHRDAIAVRRLLAEHAEFRPLINAPLFPFNAPAIVACAGDAAMVDVLLDFGADPNRRSDWWAGGFHALHIARGAAAERLLAAGAVLDACAAAHLDKVQELSALLSTDPSRVSERGGDGQTPLHFARSTHAIDLLLDAGADIDARDNDHRATPAEWMLDRTRDSGRYALAQYLVERGAATDIFLACALGRTPDAIAMLRLNPVLLDARTGRGPYAEQPPSSSHIYMWTIGGNRSPLEVAAQFGHEDTVQAMLSFATPAQQLRMFCRTADHARAHALLREHPDLLTSLDADDRRAISDAAWDGNARAVTLMLEVGFDPATPGHDSGSALHCAAWQGSRDTVAALLEAPTGRALLAQRDARYDSSPLGWCCHGSLNGPRGGAHAEIALMLLEAGASLELLDASDAVEAILAAWG